MRITVKVGTSLLTDSKNRLNLAFLRAFTAETARLWKQGHEIIIVSSGAVAAGRGRISSRGAKDLPIRQALAAVGQGILIRAYQKFFDKYRITAAQTLLTNYDFKDRKNFHNAKNVFSALLRRRVIPIVNENDVTAVEELTFGDNDMLSAHTAAMVHADFLCILTDVNGLFTEDPKRNPKAKIVPVVSKVTRKIHAFASGARSENSMGGMITKLRAAEFVTKHGIPMFIANGRRLKALEDIASFFRKGGEAGRWTYFEA